VGRRGPDAGALAGLALVPLVLYRGVLGLWWSHDDFFLLRFVTEHRVWQYAFLREAWRSLPSGVFMPLLLFSLDLDRALFGPDSRAFYLHQLLAADLGFLALYALLRQWLPAGWAAFGTGLALLGTPVALSLELLMNRHYLEGLAPAALSVLLFVRARAGGRWRAAEGTGSAALYFLASLAKEIFVPLPVLLFCLAPGGTRERCRRVAPHLVALALYLACRVSLVAQPFLVYGWAVEPRDLPRLAFTLPGKIGRLILGGPSPAGLLLALGLGVSLAAGAARLGRRGVGFFLAGSGIALLPVLPVSTELEPRFALAGWLLLAIAAAFGCRALGQAPGRRRFALGLAASVGLSALVVNRQSWAESLPLAERAGIEARSLLRLPAGAYLRQPLEPPEALHQLAWFRQGFLHLPAGPMGGWFADDLFLCRLPPAARIFQYSPPGHAVAEVTAAARAEGDAYCAALRPREPLRVELRYTRSILRWRLGPYEQGRYWFVFAGGVDAVEVPPAGGYRRPELSGLSLHVRYQSPEGWSTYSPELALDLAEGRHLELRRGGPPAARP
jgi:hypothetical protein